MKDIQKMIWFDFCVCRPLTLRLVIICMAVVFLISMLLNPGLSFLAILSMLILFLPVQMIAGKRTFNPLYGILPISRSSITRAGFIEYVVCSLFGELIAVIIKRISEKALIYHKLQNLINHVDMPAKEPAGAETIIAIFCIGALCICFFRMTSDIFGQENEMRIFMIAAIFIVVSFVLLYQLFEKEILTADMIESIIPATAGGKAAANLAVHLLIIGICTVFCEITVKKLAKREL